MVERFCFENQPGKAVEALDAQTQLLPLDDAEHCSCCCQSVCECEPPCPSGTELDPQTQLNREKSSFNIRVEAAVLEFNRDKPFLTTHPTNGDEARFQKLASEFQNRFIASYTKGLPLNPDSDLARLGEVDPEAYCALLRALESGDCEQFEAVPLGSKEQDACPDSPGARNLEDPQGGLVFDLQGADSHAIFVRKTSQGVPIGFARAPSFDGAEIIGEIAENYWMALMRDVPFDNYTADPDRANPDIDPGIVAAAAQLSNMSQFKGPKAGGRVTPATLFRGNFEGDKIGPYLSQFFMHDIPYGSQVLDGRIRRVPSRTDYMTDEDNWRAVQRGCDFNQNCALVLAPDEEERRFITNGRDLGQFVHVDNDYYGVYNACLLLAAGNPASPPPMHTRRCEAIGGLGVPFAAGLPYVNPLADPAIFPPSLRQSKNQIGVNTFGVPHLKSVVLQAMKRALDAVWYQKWNVHRRLRPEAFAGRIHFQLTNVPRPNYPFDADELAELGDQNTPNSLLHRVFFHNQNQNVRNGNDGANGTYLLPMAYAEGSPLHPSYGQGHATVAGACVTILKAFFKNVSFDDLGGAKDVDANGDVQNYAGADASLITVHGELHKLASNIGLGRDFAGVHYRSDYYESVLLGEAVALSLLEDQFATFNEEFRIEFRRFNGEIYCLEKTRCGRVV